MRSTSRLHGSVDNARRFGCRLALVLFTFGLSMNAARAVTLVCTGGGYGETTLDVDVASASVSVSDKIARNQCANMRAQISSRYVIACGGSIVLDRRTGIVTWADHSTGHCRRVNGDVLGN